MLFCKRYSSNLGKFILFADDTNIFVEDSCINSLYTKANRILTQVHTYMKCNLLHINIKKCCYIHFKPTGFKQQPDQEDQILSLNGTMIKQVNEAKFLGVLIDSELNWKAHIQSLSSRLKCEIGKLCRIRHAIPESHFKVLYHSLFESHLGFGISVWGGVSRRRLEPLFILQKKCVRILFGDREAFLEKFRTCARTRIVGEQKLGPTFYTREHTKPLFAKNGLLTVHNLYKYSCLLEMFKIVKLNEPTSLASLFNRSSRKPNNFILKTPSSDFIYRSSAMWNSCRTSSSKISFSTPTNGGKNSLKAAILKMQDDHDSTFWNDLNFDSKQLRL